MLFERKNNGMFSLKESQIIEEYFIPLSVVKEACKQTEYEVEVEPRKGLDTKTITKKVVCGAGAIEEDGFEPETELDEPAGLTHNIEQVAGLVEDLIDELNKEDDTEQLYDLKDRLAALAGLAVSAAKTPPKSHFDRDAYNNQHNEKHREVMERKRKLKGQVRCLPRGGKAKC